MISSTVLNSGNVQCELKPSVAQSHSKMAIDGRLLSAIWPWQITVSPHLLSINRLKS